MTKEESLKQLRRIPGVGKSIAKDLWNLGIRKISDLSGQAPEQLYDLSNQLVGCRQDRCLLYVFRKAVYYAETPKEKQEPDKLKWWNRKDIKSQKLEVGS